MSDKRLKSEIEEGKEMDDVFWELGTCITEAYTQITITNISIIKDHKTKLKVQLLVKDHYVKLQ